MWRCSSAHSICMYDVGVRRKDWLYTLTPLSTHRGAEMSCRPNIHAHLRTKPILPARYSRSFQVLNRVPLQTQNIVCPSHPLFFTQVAYCIRKLHLAEYWNRPKLLVGVGLFVGSSGRNRNDANREGVWCV